MNRQEEVPTGEDEEVGDGRAEESSAIGDRRQVATSLTPVHWHLWKFTSRRFLHRGFTVYTSFKGFHSWAGDEWPSLPFTWIDRGDHKREETNMWVIFSKFLSQVKTKAADTRGPTIYKMNLPTPLCRSPLQRDQYVWGFKEMVLDTGWEEGQKKDKTKELMAFTKIWGCICPQVQHKWVTCDKDSTLVWVRLIGGSFQLCTSLLIS